MIDNINDPEIEYPSSMAGEYLRIIWLILFFGAGLTLGYWIGTN